MGINAFGMGIIIIMVNQKEIEEVLRYLLRQNQHGLDKIHRSLNPTCKFCAEFDGMAEKMGMIEWVKKHLNLRELE